MAPAQDFTIVLTERARWLANNIKSGNWGTFEPSGSQMTQSSSCSCFYSRRPWLGFFCMEWSTTFGCWEMMKSLAITENRIQTEDSLNWENEQRELTAAMMVVLCTLQLWYPKLVSGTDWHSFDAGSVFVVGVSVRVAFLQHMHRSRKSQWAAAVCEVDQPC